MDLITAVILRLASFECVVSFRKTSVSNFNY